MFRTYLRKPQVALTLLLLFNLLILSVQIRSENGQTVLNQAGLAIITPLVYMENLVFNSASSLVHKYISLLAQDTENQRLVGENVKLKIELHQLRAMKKLAEREYFSAITGPMLYRYIPGSIIHKNLRFFSDTVIVNQGTLAKVAPNQAVIGSEGLVGRVIAANLLASEIELITDSLASAGALLENSRLQCVVRGTDSGLLNLDFVSVSEPVSIGEMVYTSGTDGIYPKELPIGRIVSKEDGRVYQKIQVQPLTDFSRLEEVSIIIGE